MVLHTGIDTIIASYATTLRGVWNIPAAVLDALGCRRVKVEDRWMIIGPKWSAHIEGGRYQPRSAIIRIYTGDDGTGAYRPPMRPEEVEATLREACRIMGVPEWEFEWKRGKLRRDDYTLDELRSNSPAPAAIPHFHLFEEYPHGGALFLAGKRRRLTAVETYDTRKKKSGPATRAVIIYDKTMELQAKSGKGDEESCIPIPHMQRVEQRFSTRAACKKAGLSTVEDALTGLLVWDAIAPRVMCAMLPEVFAAAWKRIRLECSSLPEARMLCARLRASLRGGREDRPRKDVLAAVKGGEKKRDCGERADHAATRGSERKYFGVAGKYAEDCCCSPERDAHFEKGGEGKGGAGAKGAGGAIIMERRKRHFEPVFPRSRSSPRSPDEKETPKKSTPYKGVLLLHVFVII